MSGSTRDLILDATERLLGRLGYQKTTMEDIAREAGIGKRAKRHLGMKLRHCLVRRVPRRMLIGPGDIGLVLDAHARNAPFAARP